MTALGEMKAECWEMMDETGMTQAELCHILNERSPYSVRPPELCKALNGKLRTPKGSRIVLEAHLALSNERRRQNLAKIRASAKTEG